MVDPRTFPPALAPTPSAEWEQVHVGESIIMVSSVVTYGKRTCLLTLRLSSGLMNETYSKIYQASHDATNK